MEDPARQEQDRFAFESHRKAAEAYRSGFMDDLIVPCAGVFRDNNLREDISLDKLATLKPAFEKSERGTLTAANSTPLTDGAACVLLASEEWAAKRGLPVQAYLTYSATSANNFVDGDGLLMAPTIAVSRMLERAGLTLQDFDYLRDPRSVRGAGAVHAEGVGRSGLLQDVLGRDAPLGSIDRSKLNVEGSSLAVRSSVCGDRRARSRDSVEAAGGNDEARAHLGMHGGRHGRGRDPRRLGHGGSPARGLIHSVTLFMPASPAAAMVRSLERPRHEKGTNTCNENGITRRRALAGLSGSATAVLAADTTRAEPAPSQQQAASISKGGVCRLMPQAVEGPYLFRPRP